MEAKIRELSALAMGILVMMAAAVILQFYGISTKAQEEPERAQEQTAV